MYFVMQNSRSLKEAFDSPPESHLSREGLGAMTVEKERVWCRTQHQVTKAGQLTENLTAEALKRWRMITFLYQCIDPLFPRCRKERKSY